MATKSRFFKVSVLALVMLLSAFAPVMSLRSPASAGTPTKYQRGGGNGQWLDPNWTCRGTLGWTQAYYGPVPDIHVASVYVKSMAYFPDRGWVEEMVEMGWYRKSGWTQPRFLWGYVNNGGETQNGEFGSFQAGTNHSYAIRYTGYGNQKYWWAVHIDGVYKWTFGLTWMMDGWSWVGCERNSGSENNYGKFMWMYVWANIGGTWQWFHWTQPYDWARYQDQRYVDPDYCFYPYPGGYPTNNCECRVKKK